MIVKIFEIPDHNPDIKLPNNILKHCNSYTDKISRETSLYVWFMLGKYIDLSKVRFTKNGKPYVLGNKQYFSLSHSNHMASIAVHDKPIGIDIEQILPISIVRLLASRLLDDKQLKQYYKSKDNCIWFTKYWTQHEAYLKLKDIKFSFKFFKEPIPFKLVSKIVTDKQQRQYYVSYIAQGKTKRWV